MNDPDLFPELNLTRLEIHANAWATKKYSGVVKRIVLYQGVDSPEHRVLVFYYSNNFATFKEPEDKKQESLRKLISAYGDSLVELSEDILDGHKEKPYPSLYNWTPAVEKLSDPPLEFIGDKDNYWILYESNKKSGPANKYPPHLFGMLSEINERLRSLQPRPPSKPDTKISDIDDGKIDSLIRKIRVYYEGDKDLKIQLPYKGAHTYNYSALGFQNDQTKTWKELIKVLEKYPHTYSTGKAHRYSPVVSGSPIPKKSNEEDVKEKPKGYIKERNQEYDARYKLLGEINKKLISFFRQPPHSLRIPDGYKFYEKDLNRKSGVYRFKFTVIQDNAFESRLESMDKKSLLSTIKDLASEIKDTNEGSTKHTNLKDKLIGALATAHNKGWVSESQVEKLVYSDKFDIEGMFSDNRRV